MLTVRRGQLTFKKLDLEGTELEVKFLEMIWNFEFFSSWKKNYYNGLAV